MQSPNGVKPRLTDSAILTGADGFVPTPRRQLVPVSPFFEDEAGTLNAIPIPKDEGDGDAGSNTSSDSSDGEDEVIHHKASSSSVDATLQTQKISSQKRKPRLSNLTEVDLGGADPAPSMFTPAAGSKVPISPFLEEETKNSPLVNVAAVKRNSVVANRPTGSTSAGEKRNQGAFRRIDVAAPPPPPPSQQPKPINKQAVLGSPQKARTSIGGRPVSLKIDLTGSAISKASPVIQRKSTVPASVPSTVKPLESPIPAIRRWDTAPAESAARSTPSSSASTLQLAEWAIERRELQSRARRAEKRLALALIASALRRRTEAILKDSFRRWRAAAAADKPPTLPQFVVEDDAQILADELLKRLRALRGEFN